MGFCDLRRAPAYAASGLLTPQNAAREHVRRQVTLASLLRALILALAGLALVLFLAHLGLLPEQAVAVSVLLIGLLWTLHHESLRSISGLKLAWFLIMLLISAVAFSLAFIVNGKLSYIDVLLLDGRFYFVCVGYIFLGMAVVSGVVSLFVRARNTRSGRNAA